MVHKGIATLALALMMCFLLLSHFDAQFFMIHFYESLIYLAILLMLFYFEDRWAYMLGMVAPAGWLLLSFVTGGFGEFARQFTRLTHAEAPEYTASFLGAVICLLSVAMVAFCAYRWKREFAGARKGLSTFLVSVGIVTAYELVMVFWFWQAVKWPIHS
ncbi:MAG: hypothetical protein ACRD4K_14170 [Candidatus Acidiferrales bacterium]